VAVLPLHVTGDSAYRPLSRGLAQILTSDLALLQRFRMVERLQLGALMDELQLAQGDRVDQATAARVGYLVRAGRMVQGLAAIPNEDQMQLEASVVIGSGEVTAPASATGRFRDLLQLEKEIVVGLAARLGYTLSEAERRAVLENGTANLAAFLAYSRGLEAEDRGDYAAAAGHYAEAVRRDPGFQAAREGYQAATSAAVAQTTTTVDAVVLASEPAPEPEAPVAAPPDNAMNATIGDIASTQAEQTTAIANQSTPPPTSQPLAQPPPATITQNLTGTIRIVFRLP
jgi:hypothetical protein